FLITVLSAGLVTAHGQLKSFVVDGNAYPAFDPAFDYDAKYVSKRIEWGFAKGRGGVGPVERVDGKDVACRFAPLKEPGFAAPARAGSEISFKWLDWFQSHKGPVITYMGLLPENKDPYSAEFFKIDESAYDPKTRTWGTDVLMKNKNTRTVTIPSDLKPGTYIVRHEIISLHNALNDDYVKKSSGAQFYPNCINVEVTGSGTVSPPTVGKFPGAYKWDDKGILVN
ncbi:glycoside hydrolase, partial [Tothia fuscella]